MQCYRVGMRTGPQIDLVEPHWKLIATSCRGPSQRGIGLEQDAIRSLLEFLHILDHGGREEDFGDRFAMMQLLVYPQCLAFFTASGLLDSSRDQTFHW